MIAEEPDELFGVTLEKAKDNKFILINDGSFSSTEYKYLAANDPMGTFKVIQPKTKDLDNWAKHRYYWGEITGNSRREFSPKPLAARAHPHRHSASCIFLIYVRTPT